MKIEAGKIYKCRDGSKARIYATDGQGSRPIHGAVWLEEKTISYPRLEAKLGRAILPTIKPACWYMIVWAKDGCYYHEGSGIESPQDLVEEWTDISRSGETENTASSNLAAKA